MKTGRDMEDVDFPILLEHSLEVWELVICLVLQIRTEAVPRLAIKFKWTY